MIPGAFPIIGGAKKPPVLTYCSNAFKNTTTGTHTYTGLSFGTADPKRALIVVATYSSPTAVSISIGGVAATACKQEIFGSNYADIWIASVPTGTSGNVVLSGPPGSQNWTSAVGVYSVVGLRSLTATATDGAASSPVNSIATSVAVLAGGIVVSVAAGPTSASSTTWTGASGDFYNESAIQAIAGGSFTAAAAQTLSVTTTYNVGASFVVQAATAAFR